MSQFRADHGFAQPTWPRPRALGDITVSEDPSSDLIIWLCKATLVGGFACGPAKKLKQRLNHMQMETDEDEALTQLWGLPLMRQPIHEELTASCKRVTHLLIGTAQYRSEDVVMKIRTIIKQTLKRVSRFLYGEDDRLDSDITDIIQKISEKATALNDFRNEVVLLATVWISCCLLQEQACESTLIYAEQILHVGPVHENVSSIPGQETSHHRQDAVENSGTQLRGILIYLRMCAFIQTEEWNKCIDIINKDFHSIPTQLHDQVQYMKAYSLYYDGQYSEAIEVCGILFEMISQDGISSQVHNLMGCCLRQMGKLHMTLQQFRKGLTTFSVIPPTSLFNVSVTYRDLGEEVAEMESLRLLEKALDPSADVTVGDKDEADISLDPSWPAVVLVPDTRTKKKFIHPVRGIGHITALYTLARRSLDLNQIENAVEGYLDLLSILETSSVNIDEDSHGRNILLPSLQTIYLDTATSLLKADRKEEALAICDKLLSKSKLLQHEEALHLEPSSEESEVETKGSERFPFLVPYADLSSEERSKMKRSSHQVDKENTNEVDMLDNSLPGGSSIYSRIGIPGQNETQRGGDGLGRHGYGMPSKEHHKPGQTILGGRKRQRETSEGTDVLRLGFSKTLGNQLDGSMDQSDGDGGRSLCDDGRRGEELEEEMVYTAHALILQAQCLMKQGDGMASMTEIKHSLEILRTSCKEGSQIDTEMEEDASTDDRSMAKRRRIATDSDCATDDDRGSSPPDSQPTRTAILKSSAYHLKAYILMGQDQLHDAMKAVLMSLHHCPNNGDTLKTQAVLLERLGRKREAAKAWCRLKEAKASDQVVYCL